MKNFINLGCFLVLLVFETKAAIVEGEPTFEVKISKSSILLGNYFEVTFSLKNAKGAKFEAPSFNEFEIVSGPNQSSSISIVNGVTTQSVSYTYYLKPREVGVFYVAPAFIQADGETLSTEPIEINVLENPEGIIDKPGTINRMHMFQFPSDDFFNFSSPEELFEIPKDNQPKEKKKSKKKRKIYKI